MKLIIGFIIAACAYGQGVANYTQTGLVDAHGANWIPPTYTFASPPISPATGTVYIFTDASATGVCTGGGSSLATCRWSGSTYAPVGGGGGAVGPTGPTGPSASLGAVVPYTSNHTTGAGDCASWLTFSGVGVTATLQSPPTNPCPMSIQDIDATNNITVSRNGLLLYYRGGTTSNITLTPGQSVTIQTDGTNYFASDGPPGAAGPTGPSGPAGPTGAAGTTTARGAYSSGTTYAQGDLVTDSSILYASLSAGNIAHTPASSPTFWAPQAGSAGPAGATGPTGPTGPSGPGGPTNGVIDKTANYTLTSGDEGVLFRFSGTTLTASLPAAAPTASWYALIENINASPVTLSRNGLLINGAASNITLQQFQRTVCLSDGTNYSCNVPLVQGTGITLTPASNGLTVSASSTSTDTKCFDLGTDNAAADLIDADIGPQGRIFMIPATVTIIEITVAANAGSPNVILQKNHTGTATDLVSATLATAASGAVACAATGSTCLDGTSKSGTVSIVTAGSANVLAAGDWIQTKTGSGFASTGAKRLSVCATYTR